MMLKIQVGFIYTFWHFLLSISSRLEQWVLNEVYSSRQNVAMSPKRDLSRPLIATLGVNWKLYTQSDFCRCKFAHLFGGCIQIVQWLYSDCLVVYSDCLVVVFRLFSGVFRLFSGVFRLFSGVFRLFSGCLFRLFSGEFRLGNIH